MSDGLTQEQLDELYQQYQQRRDAKKSPLKKNDFTQRVQEIHRNVQAENIPFYQKVLKIQRLIRELPANPLAE